MNLFARDLYASLRDLIASGREAFYTRDYVRDGLHYRIFTYRLASYTDFLLPGAMEARGVMFEMTDPANGPQTPIRLASLPMEKFFNLNENPMTTGLDLSKVRRIEVKADGSLMSTYVHMLPGQPIQLCFKSKASIDSEQSRAVEAFMSLPENESFAMELKVLAYSGFTVNLEWCAPDNRVVLPYMQPKLQVLCVRDTQCGDYADKHSPMMDMFPLVRQHWIEEHPFEYGKAQDVVTSMDSLTGIEGFVLHWANIKAKVKTSWYLSLHRMKDNINSDRRLYEVVLSEGGDDLRALFHDDELVLHRLDKMQVFVSELYNRICNTEETFYKANSHLSRKDFAILAKAELDIHCFRAVMERYIGRPTDIKQYMMAHWKDFKIQDTPIKREEE